jgi:hypothetical protein
VSSKTPGALLHDIYEKTANNICRRKELLLNYRATVNTEDPYQRTPQALAAPMNQLGIVDLLQKAGRKPMV